jgi:predicted HicB family RNase H-like nuclease
MSHKDLNYYLGLDYKTIIEKQEFENECWYIAYATELGKRSCYGQGDNEIDAIKSFKEEKDSFIKYLYANELEIPEPLNLNKYSGNFNVRTSSEIHYELVYQSKEQGISLNAYLNNILSSHITGQNNFYEIQKMLFNVEKKIDEHHLDMSCRMNYYDNSKSTSKIGAMKVHSKNDYLKTA